MRVTLLQLTQKTFGEVLKNPKPPGYDILETKFNTQLQELHKFFQHELTNSNHIETKEELISLLDKYTSHGSKLVDKKLNTTQKKMLMQAYAKAGKKMNVPNKKKETGTSQGDRVKVALLMKRNWPLLEYVAKESGVEIRENKSEEESWGFAEELEENEREDNKNTNVDARQSIKKQDIPENTDFNSFLKKLNKVHQTPGMHVLPTMTSFEAHPTISTIEIKDSEVQEFQDFLKDAKIQSKNRDELLFRARNNYEWSSNLLSNQPRTLENGAFFTPVCVPNTLIAIQQYGLTSIINKQEWLKEELNDTAVDKFDIMKLYVDGSSGVLNNNDHVYWSGYIENMYMILSKLQHPSQFKTKIHKMMKIGWIPVSSEEREIVMVRNHKDHVVSIIKRSSIFGIVGLFLGFGVFSITRV